MVTKEDADEYIRASTEMGRRHESNDGKHCMRLAKDGELWKEKWRN